MLSMQGFPRTLVFAGLATMFTTILFSWVLVPGITHFGITQMIRLEPGNEVWTEWENVTAPIYLKIYVFNITNHEEVLNGEIPKIEELGPYVYEQKRTKEIIKENLSNGTVTYKPTMLNFFRPDLSNGTEEDRLVFLNIPLLSVASELGTMSRMIRYMARIYLDSFEEEAFVHTTVGKILFQGWHVPMIESISELMGKELMPNNTFAFFIERNGTSPDNFEVDTGVLDSSTFGNIVSWKGQRQLDLWDGPTCNMINGTDTTIYAPFVTKQTVLRVFEAEVCRSVHLTFDREDEAFGIPGYRFTPAKDIFNEENPDNQCFCRETDKTKCPKSGVVSIASCRHGAPIYISNPHFLYGDPSYAEPFGMKANATLHESNVIIEPRTGVAIKGNKRIQLNTLLRPSTDIDAFANVANVMVPLVWIDEDAVQEPQLDKIRYRLVIPLLVLEYAKWFLLGISCVMILIGIVSFMRFTNEKNIQAREQEKFLYV